MQKHLKNYANRSYWVARYSARDDVYEWECDWSLLPRKGLTELILVAPGGKAGVLGHSSGSIEGRAFQFKIADTLHGTTAQVIGVVLNPQMDCVCYAYDGINLQGPFRDNIEPGRFQYGGGVMATPSYEVLGIDVGY